MTVELHVPAAGPTPALLVRPWLAADMPALLAEMKRELPDRGLWSNPDLGPGRPHLTGPTTEAEADEWLASQDRGWHEGDWLTFAVLARSAGGYDLAGHVGLKNRDVGGRIGKHPTGEISYWTALAARGQSVAPAAVSVVTEWAFATFGRAGLREIMAVHDVDNPASCRVAEKAGYPYKELSPARPPLWFTDGHIHLRLAS
jgi:RimJ/RimL family protein N-acetyltransferase